MTNPFKAGDRVRCIRGSGRALHQGAKYTVTKVSGPYVYLDPAGFGGGWACNRFELVISAPSSPVSFKAGDRVRCLHNCGNQFTEGKIYEVAKDYQGHGTLMVALDDRGSTTNGWAIECFEKVSGSSAQTFIISLRTPDGFAPAATPRTYTSREQADKVAQEMAGKHGGDFVVFQAVAVASRPIAPVTLTSL